ncbi:MAG TPA: hypothetical protein VFX70_21275 [Mycobacteriales bacterium]|nr:hypothetical protein [Mycobacteriales bacterium]
MDLRRGGFRRLIGVVVFMFSAILLTNQPALASVVQPNLISHRCSDPVAVGPNLQDTLEACFYWDSGTVQGKAFYFTSAGLATHSVGFDITVSREGGDILHNACANVNAPINARLECDTNIGGNLSGNEGYVARSQDVLYTFNTAHTEILIV